MLLLLFETTLDCINAVGEGTFSFSFSSFIDSTGVFSSDVSWNRQHIIVVRVPYEEGYKKMSLPDILIAYSLHVPQE